MPDAPARSRRRGARLSAPAVVALSLPLFLPLALPLAGQGTGTIRGRVTTLESERPLEGVRVSVVDTDLAVLTDADGRFLLRLVPAGERHLRVLFPGAFPARLPVEVRGGRDLRLELSVGLEVVPLPTLRVSVEGIPAGKLAGFHRRMERGFGRFITRAEIERRRPRATSDLLRTVPGVRVGSDATPGTPAVEIPRGPRDCPVTYFLDGLRVPGFHVDQVTPEEIDGIEIYRGPSQVPPVFRRKFTCAAVAVWTRDPGRR